MSVVSLDCLLHGVGQAYSVIGDLVHLFKEDDVANEPGGAAPQREEEEDYDLLTYGEAGVRLHEEIQAQARLAEELEQQGDARAEAARQRLIALQEAAARNSRQPINEENFERFFGYKGSPRRNT
jgi:hypothetical protein